MRGFKDASDAETGEKLESDRLSDEIGEEAEAEKLPDEVKDKKDGSNQEAKNTSDGGKQEVQKEPETVKNDSKEKEQEYRDDNGVKYREGDNLIPNNEYEVRGYQYKTDGKGRIVEASGKLKMKAPDYKRDMESVRRKEGQEYRDTDDRGHLIGHQFGGSDRLENLVPMDAKLNQGDFVKLETTLADAVKDSADVRLKVEPIYDGDSNRPSEFRVTYSIDGDKDVVVFKNESEEKS